MSIKQLYIKNSRIWVPHPDIVWEGAVLTSDYRTGETIMRITTDKGVEKIIPIANDSELPPLRNPAILIGQNDLTALSYLHEPDVLHNLEVRFCGRQAIYTYCGIVLVAINPYAELPLYGKDIIRAYRGHAMGDLEPHIFAVAEEAYSKLEREKCDLSIIVSGESGAGKTVSAKYAMRYFAAVGGNESETHIERKVLASSPILESFGNAKTTRNDNSSRFGKFTKLLFTNDVGSVMSLTGATMQTYLLEKSRVVFQAPDERNYHIFYQLCAAREQWPELMLDHQDKFRYLNQGNSPYISKVSDIVQFSETEDALYTLGFSQEEVKDIVKILAAILHLGNIHFLDKSMSKSDGDCEGCDVIMNDLHFNLFADILKLNTEDLHKWLTIRQIESTNEVVLIPINSATGERSRDALAKHLYAKLFEYIVNGLNKSLNSGKKQNCFIGVLDIYGFETFETNSFEQFCINYANEKLQQQFNQHVFKLEQDEYLKEGIVWQMIDFYDNQPCIDLIESKLGILDLLDEECRMPKGSDESWAGKLFEKCTKYQHFDKPRFGTTSFLIRHFSDLVEYDSFGFLEKNRDTVSRELVYVLQESKMKLCSRLMRMDDSDSVPAMMKENNSRQLLGGGRVLINASKPLVLPGKQHKQTVGSQFRDSLKMLITTLHSTTPHYVRCIKPNENKLAFEWEPGKIVQQLRACGVLETIRISAAGFPSRWHYDTFFARYRLLCKQSQIVDTDPKMTCTCIVRNWINDKDKYRFGHTQIFFRAGQVAYLEQVRIDIRKKSIIIVQSQVRRFIYWRRYSRLRKCVLGLQQHARGFLARKKAQHIRENRAAITMQRYVRGWLKRKLYLKIRAVVLGLQTRGRAILARQRYFQTLDNYKATIVQKYCRGYLVRKAYNEKLRKIILCQSVVRRFLARRLYKKLKIEARTISHMQKMYKGLENKIISLQYKIDELNKEKQVLNVKITEIPELRGKLEQMKSLENEMKSLRVKLSQERDSMVNMTKNLGTERDEKILLLKEKDRLEDEWNHQKQSLETENEELKQRVQELSKNKDIVTINSADHQLAEVESKEINHAYQRAVKDKELLENDNMLLREELQRIRQLSPNSYSTHSRNASNTSNIIIDEDIGYASAKNTLELKRNSSLVPPVPLHDLQTILNHDSMDKISTSTTRSSDTVLILKLRKILDEEKEKRMKLEKQLHRLESKSNTTISNEDSIRVSELEVENNKLRQEYELLRNSIERGVETHEVQAQYKALQDENKRRREECIQLRSILAHQSQSLRTLGGLTTVNDGIEKIHEGNELLEAFRAQKLVNRQLESELSALTEENNAKLMELSKHIDDLKEERNKLQEILLEKLNNSEYSTSIDALQQTEMFLRYELEKSLHAYAELQSHNDMLAKKMESLNKTNSILMNRLRDNGLDVTVSLKGNVQTVADVKKKAVEYRGIFKYAEKDTAKIMHKLIIDLTPRVAITLLPGLPAYIIFMCIRYTDLLNTDKDVRSLLTMFILNVKKLNRSQISSECRILWMVNTVKLHNLLRQYGGFNDLVKLNTDTQNQQQLSNFDLSEYRQVILELIINIYAETVRQVQDKIKPHIVPAILEHDETAGVKNKAQRSRTKSLDTLADDRITEPKSLVNQIEHFHKQFRYFDLSDTYIEQIFKQLMYFICANSMNNLMLRPELCTWRTGMKLRYNVGCLENWVRQKKMPNEIMDSLQPLLQVSSMLQSRKSEDDVDSFLELCSSLTPPQIMKIVKSYTWDDCETPIETSFIEKLGKKLNEKKPHAINNAFMMEENLIGDLKVVYQYDKIRLEEIELPPILNLDGYLTKI